MKILQYKEKQMSWKNLADLIHDSCGRMVLSVGDILEFMDEIRRINPDINSNLKVGDEIKIQYIRKHPYRIASDISNGSSG